MRSETVVITLVALALFLAGGTSLPPLPGDEARFVQAAREMRAAGEWVVPTVAGQPRYDKPILVYWALIAGHALLGDRPLAARLPSALAAALTVGLIASWARRRWGPGAGATAGGLLAATFVVHLEAKAATADALLLTLTVVALLALERLYRGDGGTATRATLWLALGLAVLAKGPVTPVVAVTTLAAAWALYRQWSRWELGALALVLVLGWYRLGPLVLAVPLGYALVTTLRAPEGRAAFGRLGAGWGLPLAAAIVAPWAIAAFVATDGEFFRVAIGRHVVTRALTPLEGHGGVPGWYLLTGPLAAFPWFLLLVPVLAEARRRIRADAETRFLVAWLVGPLFVFELAQTKLVHYWMPAYPAAVLLITGWLTRRDAWDETPAAIRHAVTWGTVSIGLVLAAAPASAALYLEQPQLLRPALLVALPLLLGLLGFARFQRARLRPAVLALAAGAGVWAAALAGGFLRPLTEVLVERRAARVVAGARAPGDAVVVYQVRAPDVLVAFPAGTVACATPACVAGAARDAAQIVGVAPARALAGLGPAGLRVERVAAVGGIDLVHGRWEGWVVFRARRGAVGGMSRSTESVS